MDTEREDIELRELFRNKLENAEVVPDQSVGARLMRRLARQEFVTFNPARFNIYYLGGLIIAGITAALILAPGENVASNASDTDLTTEIRTVPEIPSYPVTETIDVSPESKSGSENISSAGRTKSAKETGDGNSKISGKSENRPDPVEIDLTGLGPVINRKAVLGKIPYDSDKLIISPKGAGKLFVSSVTEGCVPLKVRFIILEDNIDSCRWTFGDGGVSYKKTPEWIFDVDGEYKVVLELFSGAAIIRTYSEIIRVFPRPVANFEINPGKAVIPDEEVRFINYSTDAVRYSWNFGDGTSSELFEPNHKYLKYGNYNVRLIAINEYGCSDSVIVRNAFSGSKYFIEFPNAFIPNPNGPSGGTYSSKSDESAQVFHPSSSGVTEYQLRIFSKMGILIFESNDINIGWDGYLNGQLSNAGVYIWKVRGKYRNGEPFTKLGDVTLLKNN